MYETVETRLDRACFCENNIEKDEVVQLISSNGDFKPIGKVVICNLSLIVLGPVSKKELNEKYEQTIVSCLTYINPGDVKYILKI